MTACCSSSTGGCSGDLRLLPVSDLETVATALWIQRARPMSRRRRSSRLRRLGPLARPARPARTSREAGAKQSPPFGLETWPYNRQHTTRAYTCSAKTARQANQGCVQCHDAHAARAQLSGHPDRPLPSLCPNAATACAPLRACSWLHRCASRPTQGRRGASGGGGGVAGPLCADGAGGRGSSKGGVPEGRCALGLYTSCGAGKWQAKPAIGRTKGEETRWDEAR